MPNTSLKSCAVVLGDAVADRIESVLSGMGIADADDRVWQTNPPERIDYPWVVYDVREGPSVFMSNKDSEDVRGVATIRVHGLDSTQTKEIGGNIQADLIDRDNVPSVDGFRVVWHELINHLPLDDIREDAPNIYGRVIEIEFHLEVT